MSLALEQERYGCVKMSLPHPKASQHLHRPNLLLYVFVPSICRELSTNMSIHLKSVFGWREAVEN